MPDAGNAQARGGSAPRAATAAPPPGFGGFGTADATQNEGGGSSSAWSDPAAGGGRDAAADMETDDAAAAAASGDAASKKAAKRIQTKMLADAKLALTTIADAIGKKGTNAEGMPAGGANIPIYRAGHHAELVLEEKSLYSVLSQILDARYLSPPVLTETAFNKLFDAVWKHHAGACVPGCKCGHSTYRRRWKHVVLETNPTDLRTLVKHGAVMPLLKPGLTENAAVELLKNNLLVLKDKCADAADAPPPPRAAAAAAGSLA